jgi:hypothetical protein
MRYSPKSSVNLIGRAPILRYGRSAEKTMALLLGSSESSQSNP